MKKENELAVVFARISGPSEEADLRFWRQLLRQALSQNECRLVKAQTVPEAAWNAGRRLVKTHIEWHKKDSENSSATYLSPLLSHLQSTTEATEEGCKRLIYSVPASLFELLRVPRLHRQLEAHLTLSFSTKYAAGLLQSLLLVVHREPSTLEVSVAELRSLLGVAPQKLKKWHHLRQRALEPAVEELNRHAEAIGFRAKYKILSGPRSRVLGIVFKLFRLDDSECS